MTRISGNGTEKLFTTRFEIQGLVATSVACQMNHVEACRTSIIMHASMEKFGFIKQVDSPSSKRSSDEGLTVETSAF